MGASFNIVFTCIIMYPYPNRIMQVFVRLLYLLIMTLWSPNVYVCETMKFIKN